MKSEGKLLIGANMFFLFFLAIVFCPPFSNNYPGELSAIALVKAETEGERKWNFDLDYDPPTGAVVAHVPVWPIHVALILGTIGFVGAGLQRKRSAYQDAVGNEGHHGAD